MTLSPNLMSLGPSSLEKVGSTNTTSLAKNSQKIGRVSQPCSRLSPKAYQRLGHSLALLETLTFRLFLSNCYSGGEKVPIWPRPSTTQSYLRRSSFATEKHTGKLVLFWELRCMSCFSNLVQFGPYHSEN